MPPAQLPQPRSTARQHPRHGKTCTSPRGSHRCRAPPVHLPQQNYTVLRWHRGQEGKPTWRIKPTDFAHPDSTQGCPRAASAARESTNQQPKHQNPTQEHGKGGLSTGCLRPGRGQGAAEDKCFPHQTQPCRFLPETLWKAPAPVKHQRNQYRTG